MSHARLELMWSTLSFLALRRFFRVLGLGPKSDDKDVEIAVLRHQPAILERQTRSADLSAWTGAGGCERQLHPRSPDRRHRLLEARRRT
jgi:hypothetical protein